MDNRIRRNEICAIGLPGCDFVFSSTRSCFIGYGFEESTLEMTVIRNVLEKQGIQPIEAGGHTTPGQNAFCAKICSKIITSQFCIILLNNDTKNGSEVPNANVNMEYGLMLGFNKYVIPFQKETQKLPFNVAGLDTIKYTSNNLEDKAANIIAQAIEATKQKESTPASSNQYLSLFLLTKNLLISPIDNEGEKNLYRLGEPVGFNFAVNFAGMEYTYLGEFSTLRIEVVVWRIKKLIEILDDRGDTLGQRNTLSGSSSSELAVALMIFGTAKILVIVTSDNDKKAIENKMGSAVSKYPIEIISRTQIDRELSELD